MGLKNKVESTSRRTLRRLIKPVFTLLIILVVGQFQEGNLDSTAAQSDWQIGLFNNLYTIAIWISGAFLVNRIAVVVILERALAGWLGRQTPKIIKDITCLGIYSLGLIGLFNTMFNKPMTGFWATSGILGIVIGLALRPIILDFFSGLGANLERAFQLQDWVKVMENGIEYQGWIEEINWRTTQIKTREGNLIILPNSCLSSSIITNLSRPTGPSRFCIKLLLPLEVPSTRAIRILNSAVISATHSERGPLGSPAPETLISNASSDGVEYWIRNWVNPSQDSYDAATHLVYASCLEHLGKAGISLARPQEDIYLAKQTKSQFGLKNLEDRIEFLQRIELFEELDGKDTEFLANQLQIREFEGEKSLVKAGDEGTSMFLVAEGTLRVVSQEENGVNPISLGHLNPGDFFGEMSLLTGAPRSATVIASEDCVTFEIGKESIKGLLKRNPGTAAMLSEAVAERQLRKEQAIKEGTAIRLENQKASLSGQLLSKMKDFFSLI